MIRLGVPSKGRLMEKTFDWFGQRGLTLRRTGSDREYAGRVDGAEIDLVLLSASEVPRELAAGRLHLGVTGSDLVRETLVNWGEKVEALTSMGFGHADLILAVPKIWVDCDTPDDLDAVAAQFRATHGYRLRIATKYHRLVREYLRDHDVADYQLVDSQGATEGTVANGTAEAIADITSTGETLRANHLKVLGEGPIHASQATLYKSRVAEWDKRERATLAALLPTLDRSPRDLRETAPPDARAP
jgi:ATP phosphoribosyltransferase